MSRSTLAATSAPGRRVPAALLATAVTTFGLLAGASPAHADSVVQIAGPAGPVPANTGYTVTLDVPNTNPNSRANSTYLKIALSGAAATVTSATTSSDFWTCDFTAGSSGECWHLANLVAPVSITLTVVPTAGGTVTTGVDAFNSALQPVGKDSLSTRVQTPAPVVTGLAPGHGPLAGGSTVVLTGTNLTGASAVNFGATAATSFTVDSDTQITATAPAGSSPGAVDVSVTTPGGTAAAPKYTYDEGSYVFSKTADPASGSTVKAGDKVTYSVTVAQKGTGEVKGATLTDDLSKVLDDAAYNDDVKATSGTAEVKDGKLTWTGDLPQGGTATITYSVTVNGNGDKQLHNTVTTSDTKRGTCDTEKACATDHAATVASTPSPTPTSTATSTPTATPPPTSTPTPTPTPTATPTDAGQTPGTPAPSASTTAPAAPGHSASPAPVAPVAPVAAQTSGGALASTGSTALTTTAVSGALLILGGLAVAVSRRRRLG
ncbi:IPT/TIG domain-containing protein [Kitasatospora sp. NPDC057965]|uniref:DUF7927 domain-containing protein n=1 Tax=Kitasatospora sp. NPDC057965 TaxID=3346291 RepID=UPI0036DE92FC